MHLTGRVEETWRTAKCKVELIRLDSQVLSSNIGNVLTVSEESFTVTHKTCVPIINKFSIE